MAPATSVNLIAEQTAANGGSEATAVAGEGEQHGNVFARGGEREERDDSADGGQARPVAGARRVADCEAGEGEEQAVGEHVAVVE